MTLRRLTRRPMKLRIIQADSNRRLALLPTALMFRNVETFHRLRMNLGLVIWTVSAVTTFEAGRGRHCYTGCFEAVEECAVSGVACDVVSELGVKG